MHELKRQSRVFITGKPFSSQEGTLAVHNRLMTSVNQGCSILSNFRRMSRGRNAREVWPATQPEAKRPNVCNGRKQTFSLRHLTCTFVPSQPKSKPSVKTTSAREAGKRSLAWERLQWDASWTFPPYVGFWGKAARLLSRNEAKERTFSREFS